MPPNSQAERLADGFRAELRSATARRQAPEPTASPLYRVVVTAETPFSPGSREPVSIEVDEASGAASLLTEYALPSPARGRRLLLAAERITWSPAEPAPATTQP
jgi:hypothetical protein